MDRFLRRFDRLIDYPAWEVISDRLLDLSFQAFDDAAFKAVTLVCVEASRGLGLPIGPRQCTLCDEHVLLDEDADNHDLRLICGACEREAAIGQWRQDKIEMDERIRRGRMTFDEMEAANERRREARATASEEMQNVKYMVNGLIKRNVQ